MHCFYHWLQLVTLPWLVPAKVEKHHPREPIDFSWTLRPLMVPDSLMRKVPMWSCERWTDALPSRCLHFSKAFRKGCLPSCAPHPSGRNQPSALPSHSITWQDSRRRGPGTLSSLGNHSERVLTCMHTSSQSWPNRITMTRSSSERIAWSTAHPLCRCGSRYDIGLGDCEERPSLPP